MPRVARSPDQLDPRPLQPVYRDASAPAEAFGAGIAAGLGRVAAVVAEAAEREQQNRDAEAIIGYENELSTLETDLTLGERGAFNRQGAAARGVTGQALEAWDKAFQEVLGRAANQRQQVFLQGVGGRRRAALERDLSRHEMQESRKAEIETYDTRIAQGVDEAIRKADDAEGLAQILQAVEPVIRARGNTLGEAPDVVQERIRKVRSAAYAGAIGLLLDRQQTAAAQDLFGRVKKQLSAQDLAGIERPMTIATDLAVEQREEDRIVASARGADGRIDLGRALDLTRDPKLDPKLRERLDDRIRRRVADEDAVHQQRVAGVFDAADRQFVAGGGRIDAIAPTLLAALPSEKLAYFRRTELDVADGRVDVHPAKVAGETWTDWWEYEQLSPSEKVRVDLKARFKGLLPNAMWVNLVEEQSAIRDRAAREDAKPDKYSRFESADEAIKESAKRVGIFPKATSSDKGKARYAIYQSKARAEIRRLEEKEYGGKQIANESEVQAVIDHLLIDYAKKGLWGGQLFQFEIEPGSGDLADPLLENQSFLIPSQARLELEADLKAKGIPVTEAALRKRHFDTLRKMVE